MSQLTAELMRAKPLKGRSVWVRRLDVFPVDINVQRVFERLGILKKGLKHYQAQRIAPPYVPEGRSRELHIGLMVHGRSVCQPIRPKCDECKLSNLCRTGHALRRNTDA